MTPKTKNYLTKTLRKEFDALDSDSFNYTNYVSELFDVVIECGLEELAKQIIIDFEYNTEMLDVKIELLKKSTIPTN